MSNEYELGSAGGRTEEHEALRDAIDLASDQDRITYLTSDGKRIAAICPVDAVTDLCIRHLQPVAQQTGFHRDGNRCRP